jgi:cysteinyl-tRNA synthetase
MKLFDSLSKEKIELPKSNVKIYSCGPTVYDLIHIGNTRPIFIGDVIVRALTAAKTNINFLMNITDIDDKIINRAIEHKTSDIDLAKKYTKKFLSDLNDLQVVMPNKIIPISSRIDTIIDFIDDLVKNESAYFSEGNVYFEIEKFKDEYGKISHQKLDELIDGVRIENDQNKKSPLDFALWKATSVGRKFLTKWSSGRPGWHTECVALIDEYFGDTIDIHIGGTDLRFPHHENERIQFMARNQKELSKIWFHVGHVLFDGQKMSKSVGNIITIDDFLAENNVNDLRYVMLVNKYSQQTNLTYDLIAQAKKWNERNESLFRKINWMLAIDELSMTNDNPIDDDFNIINFRKEAMEALNDDLNTAKAISVVDAAIKYLNNKIKNGFVDESFNMLNEVLAILGFDYEIKNLAADEIHEIKKWQKLVQTKKFEEADALRKKLLKKKII